MKKINLLISSILLLLVFVSCDVSTSTDNPQEIKIPGSTNSGETIDFTTYTPPTSRLIKHGADSVQFNADNIPFKANYGFSSWESYEEFSFDLQGSRTGSTFFKYNSTTALFENKEYSTIEYNTDGYEIKRNYFNTADDTLTRYQKAYYLNGKISKLENYDAFDVMQQTREFDTFGRVTKITGITAYWDCIFTFGDSYDPKPFTIDITYYYNTNLPNSLTLNEATTGTIFTLTYIISNGVYKSAELVNQDGDYLSKIFFEDPIAKDFGFIQKVTAYRVTGADSSFLHHTFDYSNSLHKVFRISSNYQFLRTIDWSLEYENIPSANGIIPALFNM